MSATQAARRLVDVDPGHPVVSVYLDLDPERFATPPARASEIRSLLDRARREVEGGGHDHDDLQALREDLQRIDGYLLSDDPPFQGAHGLAIFCSLRDDLFEVVPLTRPVEADVVIDRAPYIGPLIRNAHDRTWCVALVSRRSARVLCGPADRVEERQRIEDNVHGQHGQGGLSHPRYQRSIEEDTDDHLRRVAEMLHRRWMREQFDRLALGGPTESVARLEAMLHQDLRPLLCERRVEVDVGTATEDSVRRALAPLAEEDERSRERAALARLQEGLARGARACASVADTLSALAERRVGTLLLEPGFFRPGGRCPQCGLLLPEPGAACPVDRTPTQPVERLAEAAVEAALAQDAEILFVRHAPDLDPHGGIAALLRF